MYLIDRRDGRPLNAVEGHWRLVIPDEGRHARWIRGLVLITQLKYPTKTEQKKIKQTKTKKLFQQRWTGRPCAAKIELPRSSVRLFKD